MSKITVIVTGETGSGKSAIAGEIEIALKAIGIPVVWKDADREWWQKGNEYWIDLYKPEVTIVEQNIPIQTPRPDDPTQWAMTRKTL
jgi:dephospho-CoA kinase